MSSPTTDPTKVLQDALQEFQDALSKDEKQQLMIIKGVPNAASVLTFTASLDRMNPKQRGSSLASRLYSALLSCQQFSGVVDTFVSSKPETAALVWGAVKFAMKYMVNFTSYFQDMSRAFMRFDEWSPRFTEYSLLFPDSVRLQRSLCVFYATVIMCCKDLILISKRPWQTKLAAALLHSFNEELTILVEKIKSASREVQYEVDLAKAQNDLQEQEMQAKERSEASKLRESLVPFMGKLKMEVEQTNAWRTQINARNRATNNRRLLESLSTFDYLGPFKQARKKRHQGTGGWLAETGVFNTWREMPASGTLWLSVGAGKTTLSASTLDHLFLQRKDKDLILFFFPRFDEPTSLEVETVLRCLLRQCLFEECLSPSDIKALTQAKSEHWSFSSLERLLRSKLRVQSQSTYVVIDALDEFAHRERRALLDALGHLTDDSSCLVKLFITNRNTLDQEIKGRFPEALHMQMDCQGARKDLEKYCKEAINAKVADGELCVTDESLLSDITDALSAGAQGMFLWAELEIEEICSQCCDEDIRMALRRLPKTLTELLTRALARIVAKNKATIAKSTFQWVMVAVRPLTLMELHDALHIEVGQQFTRPERMVAGIQRLPRWCEHLVDIEEESEVVRLIHPSIRQFLLDESPQLRTDPTTHDFHISLDSLDQYAGDICVTYLSLNDFKTALATVEKPAESNPLSPLREPTKLVSIALKDGTNSRIGGYMHRWMLRKDQKATRPLKLSNNPMALLTSKGSSAQRVVPDNTFLDYAMNYWIYHGRSAHQSPQTHRLWKGLVEGDQKLAKKPWPDENPDGLDEEVVDWALSHRNHKLLRHLIFEDELQLGLYQSHSRFEKARFVNFHQEPSSTVAILAEAENADLFNEYIVNRFASESRKTILHILVHGLSVLYPLRIARHVLPPKQSFTFTADTWNLIQHLPQVIVTALYRLGDGLAQTSLDIILLAFQLCAARGETDAVRNMLDAYPEIPSKSCSLLEDAGIIEMLIRNHWNEALDCIIDAIHQRSLPSDEAFTSMRRREGHQRITEVTINDILSIAIKARSLETVERLLRNGANANMVNEEGLSALQLALPLGDQSAEQSPLLSIERFEIIELLKTHGADPNWQDFKGNTAIHTAVTEVWNGITFRSVVHALISVGASTTKVNSEGLSAFHLALRKGRINQGDKLPRFPSNHHDVNDTVESQTTFTPLHFAVRIWDTELAQDLLLWGADPSKRDSFGKKPLHYAVAQFSECYEPTRKMLEMLLGAGAVAEFSSPLPDGRKITLNYSNGSTGSTIDWARLSALLRELREWTAI